MLPAIQFMLFCAVGVATTVIDFAIFNLLARRGAGWGRIPANIVSVTVAMTWAFLANWLIVFRPSGDDWTGRAGRFLATTAFSAFILQNVILYLATYVWKSPTSAGWALARKLGLDRRFDEDTIARNTCKALAVGTGLIWNFCWYKFFVYAP